MHTLEEQYIDDNKIEAREEMHKAQATTPSGLNVRILY